MTTSETFSQKLMKAFGDVAEEKVYPKGALILAEGAVEKNLYFVKSGAIRVVYLSEQEEQTIRLGYEGSIINSLSSFLKVAPSEFYIEAIRKTRLAALSKENLSMLIHENEENRWQYTQLLELLVTQQIDREVDLLTTSPLERLNRVLERSPHLFQHIPLKYIASYLRMTPETLSRIRNS